ncbi:MAG: hypothetical protein ACTS4V_00205 [Candidatus Hodgkinia cicadicola]
MIFNNSFNHFILRFKLPPSSWTKFCSSAISAKLSSAEYNHCRRLITSVTFCESLSAATNSLNNLALSRV